MSFTFGWSKAKQIIFDQNWECLDKTRLCEKSWTMTTLRRWINLATLNPYSICKHLRLSCQKYYAKGNLEKCRPLYSNIFKQHFFPSTDDSGYVPSSRKVCLHFSVFNTFLSTSFHKCQMGWCGKKRKKSKTRGVEGGRPDLGAPQFSAAIQRTRGKKPLVQWFTCFLLTEPTGTRIEVRLHLAITISQQFFFCNHAN